MTDPHSIGWDAVEARFRELGKMKAFSSMVARMLHLVSVLRDEPQLVHLCTLGLARVGGDQRRRSARVDRVERARRNGVGFHTMTSSEHVVVEEDGVVAAVLERLGLTRA